ncbi:hypothetical protein [Streptomyces sp. NPDC053048]|uniref:hypothetical protein n=1 Tax=Streptomyces sp. NPDC053048 TaxID=3365694 RepID=UPI0037D2E385
MSARTKVVFKRGWENLLFRSTETKALVALHTSKLAAEAIKGAPRRTNASRTPWNASKKNIEAFVQNSLEGWYGNVVVERNPRVRHAMLQDQGFTDPAGRRHPGRRYLKAALLRMRVE